MKGIVVYYSGAGSTKKIAKAIHRGMKQHLDVCDIASVKEMAPKRMSEYDLIGIGSPIWYYRETANVKLFIHNMPDMTGKLCFPFCTHGSAPYGFMLSIVPPLKRKGMEIIGWNDWYGSVHYVLHMPTPYFTDGHPDEIDIREAEQFGSEMADRAIKIKAGETDLIPKTPKGQDKETLWLTTQRMLDHLASLGAKLMDMPERPPQTLKIDTARCVYPECTACTDNCPPRSLDFSVSPPQVKKNCTQCGLCQRLCVYEAIEFVGGRSRAKNVIDTTKCTHPECTLCADHCAMDAIDFSVSPPVFKNTCEGDNLCWAICPQGAIEIPDLASTHGAMKVDHDHEFLALLDEAEAQGKFRRLVPLDEVGWDTPQWKVTKTPRYAIEED